VFEMELSDKAIRHAEFLAQQDGVIHLLHVLPGSASMSLHRFAVLGALLLMKFSFNVVRLRMQYRVAYGDGGFSELQSAIRIHG
ncbi:hypothetical protein ONJ45_27765, partial [Salmonella enterica subsp. enterica serovar Virginia]|nr:hypothetical protein [Salmonella enterica subsp. enterica serovar Virginia]